MVEGGRGAGEVKMLGRILGMIPYGVSLGPTLTLERKHGYRPTGRSLSVKAKLKSLTRIWQINLRMTKPWVEYQGWGPRRRDTELNLGWTPVEGWYVEGRQTGRRTSPMPRLVAAALCGAFIWVYPEILNITLEHATKTERYVLAYLMLAVVTIVLSSLIALYMWLGYKSGPSGLEYALRQLSKVFGKDREDEATDEAKRPANGQVEDIGEKGSSQDGKDTMAKGPR